MKTGELVSRLEYRLKRAEIFKDEETISVLTDTIAAIKSMQSAGNAMADYLAPGPIPTEAPTERDFLLAAWEQAKV